MRRPLRIVVLLLCFVLAVVTVSCGTSEPVSGAPEPGAAVREGVVFEPAEGRVLGESARLRLIWRNGRVAVEDRLRGTVWNTNVTEADYDGTLNRLWRSSAASLILINYAQNTANPQIRSTNPLMAEAAVEYRKIENGIKIAYDFTDLRIRLALELRVDAKGLTASLPAADTEEYGDNLLTSVEVLPFFGSAAEDEDGCFVYPDGSGALFEFRNRAQKGGAAVKYKWRFYGNETAYLNQDPYTLSDAGNFFLPVFGVQKGKEGFAAYVSRGAEDAGINLYAVAPAIRLHRIWPEFYYRYPYDLAVSTLRGGGTRTKTEITGLPEQALLYDREIRYLFPEEDTSYSALARTLRNFFTENGILKKLSPETKLPLGADFLMSVRENTLLSEQIVMTSFDRCAQILSELREKGVGSLQVTLEGWEKGGYGRYPASYEADRRVGGKSGLKRLADFALKNEIPMFLNMNFTDVLNNGGRYSRRKDLMRNPRNVIVKSADEERFLLRPVKGKARYDKAVRAIPEGVAGLAFEGFGQTLFADFSGSAVTGRRETAALWSEMMSDTAERFGEAAVYGGNFPAAVRASRLYDIPYEHSGFAAADRSVPFFQMIFHGSALYSAEPLNLLYDEETLLLKWLEYGYMPYCKLTDESSERLKNTVCSVLFSSRAEDYVDRAAAVYRRFDELIGDCVAAEMLSHDCLAENVFRVRYDNGVTLYFNYGSKPVSADGVTVPPMDVVRREGGPV